MLVSEKILIEMVKEAMKSTAPKMYVEIVADGTLDEFAKLRAEGAMETYYEMVDKARSHLSIQTNLSTHDRIQMQTMANHQAAEIAIAQATELPNESEEDCFL